MEPTEERERVEFVPWDQLRRSPGQSTTIQLRLAGMGIAVVAGALVVAWLALGRGSSFQTEPVALAGPEGVATTLLEAEPAGPPPTVPSPVGYAEADLRAIVPHPGREFAGGVAVEFLRDYLGGLRPELHPYGEPVGSVYVEWITLLAVEESGELDRWLVTMRVGLLELGTEPRRLPVYEYAIEVSTVEGTTYVSLPVRRVGSGGELAVVVDDHPLVDLPATLLQASPLRPGDEVVGAWQDELGWNVVVRDERGFALVLEITD